MAWVTWRQHRLQALAGAAMLLALAAAEALTAVPIRAAYHRDALASCLPPSARSGCDIIVRHFQGEFVTGVSAARGLMLLPALAGLFIGAPLLARELEQGTYRLAWTQAVTRRRWLLTKTALLATGTVLAAALLSALTMWWRHPFDAFAGRMDPAAFDIEGIVVPAYAAFALAFGVLAGLLLRRTIAAMSVTLVVFVAARLVVARWVRPHFLAPLHEQANGTGSASHVRDWVLSSIQVDGSGRPITTVREDAAILHAQQGHLDPHAYLDSLGWSRLVSYQPAGRFWTFQLIEAGIFAALAALAVAVAVHAVRRLPS